MNEQNLMFSHKHTRTDQATTTTNGVRLYVQRHWIIYAQNYTPWPCSRPRTWVLAGSKQPQRAPNILNDELFERYDVPRALSPNFLQNLDAIRCWPGGDTYLQGSSPILNLGETLW